MVLLPLGFLLYSICSCLKSFSDIPSTKLPIAKPIAAPIGLNKVFGSEDSQFRIGIQARPTYLLNGNSSIRTVRSHHSEIDAVNNQSYSIYADLNRFNLGVGVNIGYFKTIKDKHGIELNVGLQEFLFDTYAVNNYSTSIQKFGVSLGYRYQL